MQFNPESLKVTYSNQVATSENKGAQTGTAAMQHVGKGTTKLAVQLWFDVNSSDRRRGEARETCVSSPGRSPISSPRKTTRTIRRNSSIPGVQVPFGAPFSFVGVMESLEETLELFSNDGGRLRASLSFGLTQQEIIAFAQGQGDLGCPQSRPSRAAKPAGTVPLTSAPAGATVQSLADTLRRRRAKDWQDIATANGIENPRLLDAGQLIDVNATLSVAI